MQKMLNFKSKQPTIPLNSCEDEQSRLLTMADLPLKESPREECPPCYEKQETFSLRLESVNKEEDEVLTARS